MLLKGSIKLETRCFVLKNLVIHVRRNTIVVLTYSPGGGGVTPIHYLYGYVPPNGVVILKLLI